MCPKCHGALDNSGKCLVCGYNTRLVLSENGGKINYAKPIMLKEIEFDNTTEKSNKELELIKVLTLGKEMYNKAKGDKDD